MPTVNEKVKDAIIKHSVDLNRLEIQMKKEVVAELRKLEKELVQQIERSKIWTVKREQTKRKELALFLKTIKARIDKIILASQKLSINFYPVLD